MKVTKAVIPAAGLGTRVLPATKSMPKEMLPIVDKPAIQYIVEEAVRSGITDILIITNRGKGLIEDHFDRVPELEAKLTSGGPDKEKILKEIIDLSHEANIYFVRQKETKGLGHAVNCARSFVGNEPFAVLYGLRPADPGLRRVRKGCSGREPGDSRSNHQIQLPEGGADPRQLLQLYGYD